MTNGPLGYLTRRSARALSATAICLAGALVLSSCGSPDEGDESAENTAQQENTDQQKSEKNKDSGSNDKEKHFEQIRQADPCEIGDIDFLEQFGSGTLAIPGSNITECRLGGGDKEEGADLYVFELDLHSNFSKSDAEDAVDETTIAGHRAFREEYSTDSASDRNCHYKLPYEDSEEGAVSLTAVLMSTDLEGKNWPEACEKAREYLGKIADRTLDPSPAKKRSSEGVTGKDPCARQDELQTALSDYELTEQRYSDPYSCQLVLRNKEKNQELTVDVNFAFHERQKPGSSDEADISSEEISMDGLYGVRTEEDSHVTKSCSNAIEVREAQNTMDDDAHYVGVHLSSSKLDVKEEDDSLEATGVSCDLTDKLTSIVLDDVRQGS